MTTPTVQILRTYILYILDIYHIIYIQIILMEKIYTSLYRTYSPFPFLFPSSLRFLLPSLRTCNAYLSYLFLSIYVYLSSSCSKLFIQCNSCREELKGTCSIECKTIVELPPEEYHQHLKTAPRIPHAVRVKPPNNLNTNHSTNHNNHANNQNNHHKSNVEATPTTI